MVRNLLLIYWRFAMYGPLEGMEARRFLDRRSRPTPIISRYSFLGGRRKSVRRTGDRHGHVFVDIYGHRLWIALLAVVTLSMVDGLLTLILLEDNIVKEANPIMAFFMGFGCGPFVVAKLLITAVPVLVFCICKNIPAVRVGLLSALALYVMVIAYELKIFYTCYYGF